MADRLHKSALDEMGSVAFLGEVTGPLFLYDPTSDEPRALYQTLASLDVDEAAAAWPFASEDEVRAALALMQEGLAEGVDEALIEEYRRLFVGPKPKAAPPWGSVYTDRECVIFGATTLALRSWLRQVGIQAPGDGTEPEDHIGLELVLMSWIARERPELLDEYLTQHLLPWAPHFLEVVERQTTHPFFSGLASLTAASLEGVQEERRLHVSTPRFFR